MFEGLKDKLGRFRKDVEETAEEKAEDADAAPEDDDAAAETEPAESEESEERGVEESDDDDAEPADAEEAASAESADAESAEGTGEARVESDEVTDEGDVDADSEDGDVETDVDTVVEADDAGGEPDADEADGEADADEANDEETDGDADEESGDEEESGDADDEADDGGSSAGFGQKLKSAARGRVVIEEEDLEDPLWDLEMALLESDVEMSVAEEILDGIREELVGETKSFRTSTGDVVTDALREALLDVISVGQFDFDERVADADKPLVVIFTGVNGVGKTTTIAKLSTYLEDQGYSTVLANGDTYRAGANEQLQEHADALGTKLISHEQGGDPAAVIYDAVEYADAHDVDVVLGDTAGRLHTSSDLMNQLEKIDRVVDPDLTIFVDEAVAGQDAVNRATEFDDAAEIDGAILTKADADSQGGAAISIAHVTGKPILFLGTGQGYDDLTKFEPEELVEELLGDEE